MSYDDTQALSFSTAIGQTAWACARYPKRGIALICFPTAHRGCSVSESPVGEEVLVSQHPIPSHPIALDIYDISS